MSDLFALPERFGAFFQQSCFEFAAPVLCPADPDDEDGMSDGEP